MDDLGVPKPIIFGNIQIYYGIRHGGISLCSMDDHRGNLVKSGGIGPDGHVAFNCQGLGRCFPAGKERSRSAVLFFFDNFLVLPSPFPIAAHTRAYVDTCVCWKRMGNMGFEILFVHLQSGRCLQPVEVVTILPPHVWTS